MAATGEWKAGPLPPEDIAEWDRLFRSHPASRSIVPKWEELAGWTEHRISVHRGKSLAGGAIMAVRRVPGLPVSLGRVTCLMIGHHDAREMLDNLLAALERFSVRHLIVETELRLRIPASDALEGFGYHREIISSLEHWGYRALAKVDTTYVVHIDKDDEDLLNSFERSARNKIRKAQKSGAVISISNDYRLLEEFYDAYLHMAARKRAPIPPKVLVGQGLKPLIEQGYALLFTESYAGRISNMVVVDTLGIPCYVLGTRTKANVSGEVPGAAQALHFEIMKTLRNRGKKYYDLGGCEGPTPVEGHPNYGVWRFKYGFQGPFVQFLPYFRKARGPFTRSLMDFVHRLRGDFV